LLVSQTGTGYVDDSGRPYYYKLAAVDIHGNQSGFALVLPLGPLDVPGNGLPAQLTLGPAQPDPVLRRAEVPFAPPRAERVRLALFDQAGQRVRDLESGSLPAGEHTARWDGRDREGRLVPSGVYFCRLEAEGRTLSRRLAAIH